MSQPHNARGALCARGLAALLASTCDGVNKVRVRYDQREAVVTFDDAKASVQKLTQATENAGYPSSVKR